MLDGMCREYAEDPNLLFCISIPCSFKEPVIAQAVCLGEIPSLHQCLSEWICKILCVCVCVLVCVCVWEREV